jgi:hypothetical protein
VLAAVLAAFIWFAEKHLQPAAPVNDNLLPGLNAAGVTAGDQNWHLLVGNRTAPGDGIYVRLVGGAGAYVTDLKWLQFLPHNANDWRDTRLVSADSPVDWIVITNGAKAIELRANPTNHTWRILRPEPVRRADAGVVTKALQQLRDAQVTHFVTDDPKADLTACGLQPAEIDVWLGHGTNFSDALHLGKETAENPGQIFVRREGWNSIVTAAKEGFLPWRGSANDFREARLLDFPTPAAGLPPVTAIEVQDTVPWALQWRGSNVWQVAGEKFPVDSDNVQNFITLLGNLRAAEYVKDVVSAADLQNFGLATNTRAFTVHFADGTTNALLFGGVDTNKSEIFVKRTDEGFVYALSFNDASRLPGGGWQLRERRPWNFSPTNVASLIVKQGDKTRQINRLGTKVWIPAHGSEGKVDLVGLEETAVIFGNLSATMWVERNFTDPEKYGLGGTNALSVTFNLKSGENCTVDFGTEFQSPGGTTALAAVTLDGERWAFVFPPALYPLLDAYLKIPDSP